MEAHFVGWREKVDKHFTSTTQSFSTPSERQSMSSSMSKMVNDEQLGAHLNELQRLHEFVQLVAVDSSSSNNRDNSNGDRRSRRSRQHQEVGQHGLNLSSSATSGSSTSIRSYNNSSSLSSAATQDHLLGQGNIDHLQHQLRKYRRRPSNSSSYTADTHPSTTRTSGSSSYDDSYSSNSASSSSNSAYSSKHEDDDVNYHQDEYKEERKEELDKLWEEGASCDYGHYHFDDSSSLSRSRSKSTRMPSPSSHHSLSTSTSRRNMGADNRRPPRGRGRSSDSLRSSNHNSSDYSAAYPRLPDRSGGGSNSRRPSRRRPSYEGSLRSPYSSSTKAPIRRKSSDDLATMLDSFSHRNGGSSSSLSSSRRRKNASSTSTTSGSSSDNAIRSSFRQDTNRSQQQLSSSSSSSSRRDHLHASSMGKSSRRPSSSSVSSLQRHDYHDDNDYREDDVTVTTSVSLRVSRSNQDLLKNTAGDAASRGRSDDDDDHPEKNNSIDLQIDANGQASFQVTPLLLDSSRSSPTTTNAPLQFDIQIDEAASTYLIQTSLGLLHQVRELHTHSNTDILRTLSHWNKFHERKQLQMGYKRGTLGIRVHPRFKKQNVVLMTLSGTFKKKKKTTTSQRPGGSTTGSSFENDEQFIKELEFFVTDSLWWYLRLYGLIDEDELQKLKNGSKEEDDCDGHVEKNVIGNSKRDLRSEFKNSSRKSERVLSRVFKKVMMKD